jgi:hypothetical protein
MRLLGKMEWVENLKRFKSRAFTCVKRIMLSFCWHFFSFHLSFRSNVNDKK